MTEHDAQAGREGGAPVPGPPRPGHTDGIDLGALRNRVTELLDQAQTGGRLTTIAVPGSAESAEHSAQGQSAHGESPAESVNDIDGDTSQVQEERLLEVTDEQVEALSAAHDELARALSALDGKR